MGKFNGMSQLECDPFLPCPDIFLGDQLIWNEKKYNGELLALSVFVQLGNAMIYTLVQENSIVHQESWVLGQALSLSAHNNHNSVYLCKIIMPNFTYITVLWEDHSLGSSN